MKRLFALVLALAAGPAFAHVPPAQIRPAIYTDPPHDQQQPAAMKVLHILSGGVTINGVAYIPAGTNGGPTLVLMHGLPGNEKNLDLAQAARRAGWTVVTFNYRGSWGSAGKFSFAGVLEDAKAVLAYIRRPEIGISIGVDPRRIVLAGHSMGGWAAAMTAESDPDVAGTILISPAEMGMRGHTERADLVPIMADNMETLAGVTAQSMADELIANKDRFDWTPGASRLARKPLLVLTADDGLADEAGRLLAAVRTDLHPHVQTVHVATDHSWSSARIRLEQEVLTWLAQFETPPAVPAQPQR